MVYKIIFSKIGLFRKTLGLMLGVFCIFIISISVDKSTQLDKKKSLLPPPPMLKHIAFGYQEVIADSLWIRAIQDLDYCDQQLAPQICQNNSWLFKMLEAATDLSPHFRIVYSMGAVALSVILTDVDGASQIFNRGAINFPKDWPILYRAAYHFLYEVGDKRRAAELFRAAGDAGAVPWVYNLSARLYAEEYDDKMAEEILAHMISIESNPDLVERLKMKLAEARAKREKASKSPTN